MSVPKLDSAGLTVEPPPQSCPTLKRLLALAGARSHQRVCVTGPQGLAVLLSLCSMGFAEACCINGRTSSCGDGPCDVLLVTGPLPRETFLTSLASALPHLRPGGVLAAHENGLRDDALIEQALAGVGRLAGWRVHDLAGSCLVAMEVLRTEREDVARAA